MIRVRLNETAIEIEEGSNLKDLVEKSKSPSTGIAIAVNDRIISKTNWTEHLLNSDDNILIIQATQGG